MATGEEFIAYSETAPSQLSPLIALGRYDQTVTFRELHREDLTRIADPSLVPGGWLFRKSTSTTGTWVKRFVILRGPFMFLFHSTQSEKPTSIIPLEGCRVVLPEGDDMSFSETRYFKANDGYEFDVRHSMRPTIRFYAMSGLERTEWAGAITARCSLPVSMGDEHKRDLLVRSLGPQNSAVITPVRLTGLALGVTEGLTNSALGVGGSGMSPSRFASNPHSAPRFSEYDSNGLNNAANRAVQLENSLLLGRGVAPSDPGSPPPPPPPTTNAAMGGYDNIAISRPSIPVKDEASNVPSKAVNFGLQMPLNVIPPPKSVESSTLPQSIPQPSTQPTTSNNSTTNTTQSSGDLRIHASEYENQHHIGDEDRTNGNLSITREARKAAREMESKDPLTLAELFRFSLCFYDDDMAEDPRHDSKNQMPYVKGHASEEMLLVVYQKYCSSDGFMTLDGLMSFMDDASFLQTHCPHDDNDEPLEEFTKLLDPMVLASLVPRLNENDPETANYYATQSQGRFTIDFGQFYQLLLYITSHVYRELYEEDPTIAFSKIIKESIIPLYLWVRSGHIKAGAIDPLVVEERIHLVTLTYAPNLWRVFLTYAVDAVSKIPDINMPFPDAAQFNERGMFRLLPTATQRLAQHPNFPKVLPDSLFISEVGLLRFARDYALSPYLATTAQIREYWRNLNRTKVVVSSKLPMREGVTGKPPSLAQTTRKKKDKEKDSINTPMSFSKPSELKSPRISGTMSTTVAPAVKAARVGGLGFSEFIEFIARIAVDGMRQPEFNTIFPTPYAKVLAALTVWGIADMNKLEEVRIIRSDDPY